MPTLDPDDNVLPFPRGQFEKSRNEREALHDELPVRSEWKPGTCKHERSTVDKQARTVNCRDCGVALDPIYVLAKIAHNREFLVDHGRHLNNECDYLQRRVDDLTRQEKNVKARLRNAEHPALKEARQALTDAGKVLYEVQAKIAFDPTLQRRTLTVWGRVQVAADGLKPIKAVAS